jgi:ATP-dependent protease HslVU (ClpYQ) peptidase subunit
MGGCWDHPDTATAEHSAVTTIAYARGVLACDSRLTEGEVIATDRCKKIWRLKDGSLFGSAGDNESGLLLLTSLKKNHPLPKFDRDLEAIRVFPNGQIFMTEGLVWDRWPETFIAVGSGGKFARAALLAGATAAEAVKVGIAMDVYSNGRVQTLKLKVKR